MGGLQGPQGPPPPPPLSLQQAIVNKLLSLTTSLLVESDNAQLLHTLLVLECELVSGVCCVYGQFQYFIHG